MLFDETGVSQVGSIRRQNDSFRLPVTLTEDATATVSEIFRAEDVSESPDEFEIVIRHDGSVRNRFGIAPEFATTISDSEWDGAFVLTFDQRANATDIRKQLT